MTAAAKVRAVQHFTDGTGTATEVVDGRKSSTTACARTTLVVGGTIDKNVPAGAGANAAAGSRVAGSFPVGTWLTAENYTVKYFPAGAEEQAPSSEAFPRSRR